MSHRQIATSTLWQLGSQISMAVLSIVTTKFVAIGLEKELAGTYNTAYGYLQFFGILADFGLYAVSVREVSRATQAERERVLGTLITLRSIILGISLAAALFFVWIFPHWRGSTLPPSVTIAATVPLFTLLAGILRTVFQVEHRMHFVFIAEVTQRIITASLIGLFIAAGIRESTDPHILFAFLGIGGLGAFVLFVLSLLFAKRITMIRPHCDRSLLQRTLQLAAPYGLAFLCTALYRQFDITLIARLRPDFELQNAYYGFVQRMMDMAYLLPTFLLNSTLPSLTQKQTDRSDTRNFLGKTLLAIALISIVSFLFAFSWPRPLTQLLTTEQYLSTPDHPGSDTALQLLAFSMFFNGFILYCFYSLLALHRWKPLITILSAGALFSIVCNLWLIPGLGFVGAAITSVIVHAFLAMMLLPITFQYMPVRVSLSALRSIVLFALLLGIPLWLTRTFLTTEWVTVAALIVATMWMGGVAWVTGIRRNF